ncbi:glycosyl hydrolase family 8 [Crassaminicella profunda]|uniref:glycosyl hydrolase family 8 n=1 Tax=Crassaminicella profunda TaxID=1286698 RepID=UPI001CA6A403|nr:glycosyl hydrolase family 8 [Crassaminicella profunda]QZY56115.1 glycosyl hydrolase family 8 [Crassaminicella profunda]
MKRVWILLILLFIGGYFIFERTPEFSISDDLTKEYKKEWKEETICLDFIKNKLSSESGGIYTNYLDTKKLGVSARGHEILSESEGLMMLYFVKKRDKKYFDVHLDFVEKKMMEKQGWIKWRIREENENISNSSASLDDIRIARCLAYAHNLWKDERYYKILKKISRGLLKYNLHKEVLTNYYDFENHDTSVEVDLSYIDLYTMHLLSEDHKKWKMVYKNGLSIIEAGYISDRLPLYKKSFNIPLEAYSNDENINMIDSLLVVLHLSEINRVKKQTIKWIREQVFVKKIIFTGYNRKTLRPISKDESTAVYAIVARIAKNIGDEDLYNEAIKKMLKLQIQDQKSSLYGAFGNIENNEVFSFDNLQALLAF